MTNDQRPRVAVIGLWHLGTVTAACLADLGFEVSGWDPGEDTVRMLKAGEAPIMEPELDDLIASGTRSGRLGFVSEISEAVSGADVVWITFDTPVDENDQLDLTPVSGAVERLAPYLGDHAVVVVSSQVPVGSCRGFRASLADLGAAETVEVVCIPENLRLGVAVERFFRPDYLAVGCQRNAVPRALAEVLGAIQGEAIVTNLETAEMVKHSTNAFLATSVSFAGQVSSLSERVGADASVVAQCLRRDTRIGAKARVLPGLGFAGGTLARDLRVLQRLGRERHVPTELVDAVLAVNQRQNNWVVDTVKSAFADRLQGARIAVLGLTYTPNTSTLRRSSSVETLERLLAEGATVSAYDPGADPDETALLEGVDVASTVADAVRGAEAVLLMTAWPVFKELGDGDQFEGMTGRLVVDPAGFLDGGSLVARGFDYRAVGRSPGASNEGSQ